MIRYNFKEKVVDYYPELTEFLDAASFKRLEDLQGKPGHLRVMPEVRDDYAANEREWRGGLSYRETENLARVGRFFEHAQLEIRERILNELRMTPEPAPYLDVAGGSAFDMGAFVQGQPECVFAYREEDQRSRKTISVIYNAAISAAFDPDLLKVRGLAFLAFVDALEASRQYRVNVYYAAAGGSGRTQHELVIRLKDTSRPYDPQALGAVIGHPGFFRQLVFGWWNQLPVHEIQQFGVSHEAGYGMPATVDELPPEIEPHAVNTPSLTFDGSAINVQDEESAVRWIVEELAKQGINCEESHYDHR